MAKSHSCELLASNIQHSNRSVRPVYSVVKFTVRLVDLHTHKKRRILCLLSGHIRSVQKIFENLMYFCHLHLVLPSPGPIKMRVEKFSETFQKSLEYSKKSWNLSKISGIFPKFTGSFPPFCNPSCSSHVN